MRNFFRLAAIIGSLPNTISNGQTADATPLMADLNFIVNQVNANAAPLANTALLNANNSFTQPQGGVSAQAVSQFVIAGDIITGSYETLTSTLGTNTITARSTQIIPSSAQAGQAVFLTPSQTNTGQVTLQRDALAAQPVLQMGSFLAGGELQAGVPTRLFFDGSVYNVIGPPTKARTLTASTSMVTPTLQSPANLLIAAALGGDITFQETGLQTTWTIKNHTFGTGLGDLIPVQAGLNIGAGTAASVVSKVFTTAIDSGTTGSLSLRTNNGTTISQFANSGAASLGSTTTPATTGVGWTFPASQNPSSNANTLDDYSEGTWTPSVGGSATYTTQTGTFTKIGRLVFIQGEIQINAIGTGSTTQISGLPFPVSGSTHMACGVQFSSALATAVVSINGAFLQATSSISFNGRTAANAADAPITVFQNATDIGFSGCYQTAT